MTARQFFDLVAALRASQKEYFKTRSKEALQQSLQLEKRVDDEITRVKNILENQKPQ